MQCLLLDQKRANKNQCGCDVFGSNFMKTLKLSDQSDVNVNLIYGTSLTNGQFFSGDCITLVKSGEMCLQGKQSIQRTEFEKNWFQCWRSFILVENDVSESLQNSTLKNKMVIKTTNGSVVDRRNALQLRNKKGRGPW